MREHISSKELNVEIVFKPVKRRWFWFLSFSRLVEKFFPPECLKCGKEKQPDLVMQIDGLAVKRTGRYCPECEETHQRANNAICAACGETILDKELACLVAEELFNQPNKLATVFYSQENASYLVTHLTDECYHKAIDENFRSVSTAKLAGGKLTDGNQVFCRSRQNRDENSEIAFTHS